MKKEKIILASEVDGCLDWIGQRAKEALKMAKGCKGKAPFMDMNSSGVKFGEKRWVLGFYYGKIDVVKVLKKSMKSIKSCKKRK